MRKIRFPRELAYVFGIIIMPFAVAFTIKADLGMSMIAAPTFILSEKILFISNGVMEYIVQGFLLLLMCIVLKKFKPAFLMSFASALIYGTILDLARKIVDRISAEEMPLRIALFVLGMVLTSFSVALFFNTYLAPCAYDYFVAKIGSEKGLDMRKWKLCFDFSMLIISLILSFALFRKPVGISVGTLVMALLNGNIISMFSKLFNKKFEFYDALPFSKYFD